MGKPILVKWPNGYDAAQLHFGTNPQNLKWRKYVQRLMRCEFWSTGQLIWVKWATDHKVVQLVV